MARRRRATRYHYVHPNVYIVERREYGFGRLLLDVFLTFLTSGLWLVWLLIKYLRNGRL